MVLPAVAVWALIPSGSLALLIASMPVAMLLSVAVASAGSAVWKRRPGSRDLVFADLMLWGLLRRVRAERRLARARTLLGVAAGDGVVADGLSPHRRVEALKRLTRLLEARDAYTHGHTRRVTRHAERIARAVRLPAVEVAQIRAAAALRDVGKLLTPPEILNKPGRLSREEFAVIRRHRVDGADMIADIGDPDISGMVRHHHERLDGSGYPDGLAGDEIPLGARIIAVADTFDAMTSNRPYHGAARHKEGAGRPRRGDRRAARRRGGLRVRRLLLGPRVRRLVLADLGRPPALPHVAWQRRARIRSRRGVGGGAGPAGRRGDSAARCRLGELGEALNQAEPAGPPGAVRNADAVAVALPTASPERERTPRDGRQGPGRPQPGPSRGEPKAPAPRPASRRTPPGGSPAGSGSGSGTTRAQAPGPSAAPVPAPAVEVPSVHVPGVQVPAVHVPSVQVPRVEIPQIRVPGVPVVRVEPPAIETPAIDVPGVDVRLPG